MLINKWKNKTFYWELFMCVSIFSMLVFVYIEHMVNKHWLRNVDYPFSPVLFQGQFASFFTFQSNALVGAYFLIRVLFYDNQIRFCKNKTLLLYVTCYITVTFITYTCVLFPATLKNSYETRTIDWIYSLFLHVVIPVSTITYTFLNIDLTNFNIRKYFKTYYWGYFAYPWIYTFYLLFRIFTYLTDDRFSSIPFEIVFPYAPVSNKTFDFGNSNSDDIIGSIVYTFFTILLLFVVVHLLFVVVNITYVLIFWKLSKKGKRENKINLEIIKVRKSGKVIVNKEEVREEK